MSSKRVRSGRTFVIAEDPSLASAAEQTSFPSVRRSNSNSLPDPASGPRQPLGVQAGSFLSPILPRKNLLDTPLVLSSAPTRSYRDVLAGKQPPPSSGPQGPKARAVSFALDASASNASPADTTVPIGGSPAAGQAEVPASLPSL